MIPQYCATVGIVRNRADCALVVSVISGAVFQDNSFSSAMDGKGHIYIRRRYKRWNTGVSRCGSQNSQPAFRTVSAQTQAQNRVSMSVSSPCFLLNVWSTALVSFQAQHLQLRSCKKKKKKKEKEKKRERERGGGGRGGCGGGEKKSRVR